MIYPISFMLLLVFIGCSKRVDINSIVEQEGVYCETNSNVPLTAVITGELLKGTEFQGSVLPDDYRFEFSLLDGIFHGELTIWYSNGQVKTQGEFQNGNKNGVWMEYYPTGQLQTNRFFINGNNHGELTEWHMNGQVLKKGLYVLGERHGEWKEWFDDGSLDKIYHYEDGILEGAYVTYWTNSNSKVLNRGLFENGLKQGEWISYYPTGQVSWRENYLNGKKHGDFTSYDFSGRVISKTSYIEGGEVN